LVVRVRKSRLVLTIVTDEQAAPNQLLVRPAMLAFACRHHCNRADFAPRTACGDH
jgi:hypothetical protein